MNRNKFTKDCLKWCQEHPSEPDAIFFLKCIEEQRMAESAELKKWKLISLGLQILAESQEQQQPHPQPQRQSLHKPEGENR